MNRWTAIIADDDARSRAQLALASKRQGYHIIAAASADEIVAAAASLPSRVILVSLMLEGLDPAQLRSALSGAPGHSYLIFTLPEHCVDGVSAAFRAAADDVIAKPLIDIELNARLRHAARVLDLEDRCAHIDGDSALLDAISARAGFHSRAYFDAQFANELARASRFTHSLSVALAQIESEPWDERTMRTLGGYLSGRFRSNVDWVARYGARRIAFVFPETALPGALRATERLDSVLADAKRTFLNLPDQLSVKYGVMALDATQISGHDAPPDTRVLLDAAEGYLNDALRSGREIVGGYVM